MPSKYELLESLEKDLAAFYEEKDIPGRVNEIADLFGEKDEEEDVIYKVLTLVDSLENIGEIIGKRMVP